MVFWPFLAFFPVLPVEDTSHIFHIGREKGSKISHHLHYQLTTYHTPRSGLSHSAGLWKGFLDGESLYSDIWYPNCSKKAAAVATALKKLEDQDTGWANKFCKSPKNVKICSKWAKNGFKIGQKWLKLIKNVSKVIPNKLEIGSK